MTEFTAGEWEITDYYNVKSDGVLITECGNSVEVEAIEEIANANLIASAPDMYAILSEISAFASFNPEDTKLNKIKIDIDKLLTKARGE